MTWEIGLVLGVLCAVVIALAVSRIGPEMILMAGLVTLLLAGVIEPKLALEGFANEGLMSVALLFVIAEGVRQTNAIAVLGNLLGQPKTLPVALSRVTLPAAAFSAFMNNTPVVAIMLPMLSEWAAKLRMSVSHLMLPLSYAAILGGLCTLIGTSTTLVINGLLIESGRPSLGMFDLAWIGIPATILGVTYLIFCSRWLLPERKPAIHAMEDAREYTVEMMVQSGSPLCGKSIEEAGLRSLPGMYLAEIERDAHLIAAVSPQEVLQGGDRLVFVGIVESVVDLQRISGLSPATDQVFKLDSPRSDRTLIEAVVSNSFPFLRTTIRDARFRSHYNAVVVAVARNGERIDKKIGDIELEAGDTLLLEAPPAFVDVHRNSRDFFLVSAVENSAPPRHERALIAQAILLVTVLLVTFEILPMIKAAFVGAGLMIATRCCRASQAKRSIDLTVLITIGAGLGLGHAMEETGAAEWLAGGMVGWVGTSPRLALAMLTVITMILTNLITAKAAGVLIFPVAMATAENLGGLNPVPFAVVVMVAAASSFATPVGYQTNLMVYGPGGYRPSDYLRLGLPLSLIVGLLTVIIAPLRWGL